MSTGDKNEARSFLFSFLASFVLFEESFELLFTLIAINNKRNAAPVQTGLRKELHHVYTVFDRSRLLVCGSFDSGPCVACLVRMRDEVLLLHS